MRLFIKGVAKRLLVNPTVHHFVGGSFARVLEQLTYLYRYSKWLKDHRAKAGFATRELMWHMLCEDFGLRWDPVTYLEFGVYRGETMRWWSGRMEHGDSRLVGFDTFTGLPEDWGPRMPKDVFTTGGKVPCIEDARVSFQVGLFQETLGPFLAKNAGLCGPPAQRQPPSRRLVVNMDADLYASTLYCLVLLRDRLAPGDIMLFDDFAVRYLATEFRALLDFASTFSLKYEVIGFSKYYGQAALRVCG